MLIKHSKTVGFTAAAALLLLGACARADRDPAGNQEQAMADLNVRSEAFDAGSAIPTEYTCEGSDLSPALSWDKGPEGTAAWALIVDDPDAPGKTWVHWVFYNLPPDTLALPKGVNPDSTALGGLQGTTDFKRVGYGGPCPPRGHGPHHYHFKLYALDRKLDLPPAATKPQVEAAMKGHILAQGELIGTYERK
jgi:Raf kinase inhibitor-like YbhB/YbcL family protein